MGEVLERLRRDTRWGSKSGVRQDQRKELGSRERITEHGSSAAWRAFHSFSHPQSPAVQKQMVLPLMKHRKVNSSLTLPHTAHVIPLT